MILPREAHVNWKSEPLRHERMCLNASPFGSYLCFRVAGHGGRHASILRDGTVRRVWGP